MLHIRLCMLTFIAATCLFKSLTFFANTSPFYAKEAHYRSCFIHKSQSFSNSFVVSPCVFVCEHMLLQIKLLMHFFNHNLFHKTVFLCMCSIESLGCFWGSDHAFDANFRLSSLISASSCVCRSGVCLLRSSSLHAERYNGPVFLLLRHRLLCGIGTTCYRLSQSHRLDVLT